MLLELLRTDTRGQVFVLHNKKIHSMYTSPSIVSVVEYMGSQQTKQHTLDQADKNCIQNSGVETCLKIWHFAN